MELLQHKDDMVFGVEKVYVIGRGTCWTNVGCVRVCVTYVWLL